jgi:predicted transcriptional regulator
MDALWTRVTASIREIQDSFPEKNRSAYTTIQTTVYRLEEKKALRRVQKIGNFQTLWQFCSGNYFCSARNIVLVLQQHLLRVDILLCCVRH